MDPKPGRIPLEVQEPTAQPHVTTNPPPTSPNAIPGGNGPNIEDKVQAAAQEQELREKIVAALKTCYDPEVPVNIYEMGLIYNIDITQSGAVGIRMTLTSPACPVAGSLPPEVQAKVAAVPGVTGAKVDVVWDPPWSPALMSEAAKLELGLFDF